MFSMKRDALLFQQMNKWIEDGENDKIKFIIEHTSPTDLANDNSETLLHLAALHGNLHIMEYLMNLPGFQVDVKDALNTTPLMHATMYERWEAATFLLKRNADIFAMNDVGETPLSNLMRVDNTSLEVLQLFFDGVKNKSTDQNELVELLRKAGCTLDKIVYLRNAEATRLFLSVPVDLNREEEFASVVIAMRDMDEENMKVLLHHGAIEGRREDFVICLRDMLTDCRRDESLNDVVRVAVEQIVKWKLLNNITVHFIELIFHESPEVSIRRLLSDDLVSYMKSEFNYDIRVHLFGNTNDCVFKMIQNGEVDMNALSRKGRTALHVATKCGAIDNMTYLLDCGMNPNIKDENGKTPIFKAFNHKERLNLLLMYGADIQACDNSGGTFLDFFSLAGKRYDYELLKIIAAHLAVLESSGIAITVPFFVLVSALDEFDYYRCCRRQLEKMKTLEIYGSLTLFESLAESLENLTRRASSFDQDTIDNFFNSSAVQEYDSYYVSMSMERLEKAVIIKNLRIRAAVVICESIEVLKPYSLVVDKIISFLSYYDLRIFEKVCVE